MCWLMDGGGVGGDVERLALSRQALLLSAVLSHGSTEKVQRRRLEDADMRAYTGGQWPYDTTDGGV
jgi:hypothetical protein